MAMLEGGLQGMLLIAVIALLVFGPSKLPELGRMFGRAMRECRRASGEFRQRVETNRRVNDLDPVIQPPAAETPAPALPSETEATPALETAAAVAVAEPGEPFCSQRGSRLFHKSDCAWVKRIPETERQYWKHVADARDQGCVACPVCEPWEPSS